jgi:hypothetical protein
MDSSEQTTSTNVAETSLVDKVDSQTEQVLLHPSCSQSLLSDLAIILLFFVATSLLCLDGTYW